MVSEAPPFWWHEPDWRAKALSPISWAYGRIARERMEKGSRTRVPVPVLCIGKFTVGGAGKTPTTVALARAALDLGRRPGILSRGYGGSLDVPTVVDPHHHRAKDVGDEPMILAEIAPTVVARDRVKGARLLIEGGADMILMDDGFQSARLAHDYALLVIDAHRGLGNGHIIPAGPVRAPLVDQMRHATALLTIGSGGAASDMVRSAARAGKPVYAASIAARDARAWKGARVLAYCGIGAPSKFYRTLEECGAEIVDRRGFADHHLFSEEEMRDLLARAERRDLILASTAKDAARLKGLHGTAETLLARTRVLAIELVFDNPPVASRIVEETISTFKQTLISAPPAWKSTQR